MLTRIDRASKGVKSTSHLERGIIAIFQVKNGYKNWRKLKFPKHALDVQRIGFEF